MEAALGLDVNKQVSLVYRSKVETEDTYYQLCFWDKSEEVDQAPASAGSYQYGYRVYGSDYNFTKHSFTNQ